MIGDPQRPEVISDPVKGSDIHKAKRDQYQAEQTKEEEVVGMEDIVLGFKDRGEGENQAKDDICKNGRDDGGDDRVGFEVRMPIKNLHGEKGAAQRGAEDGADPTGGPRE